MLCMARFFFQAEDGIRDKLVTGVQTCALPISKQLVPQMAELGLFGANLPEEYGCAGLNNVAYGLIMQELERGDSGVRSFASVQGALVMRSEEHTSELQSLAYLVCRLLLEKKKKNSIIILNV